MLTTLMVEFMTETKVPFAMIKNPKFRAVLQYMKQGMELPSHTDLVKMSVYNQKMFESWQKMDESTLKEERPDTVYKWVMMDKMAEFEKNLENNTEQPVAQNTNLVDEEVKPEPIEEKKPGILEDRLPSVHEEMDTNAMPEDFMENDTSYYSEPCTSSSILHQLPSSLYGPDYPQDTPALLDHSEKITKRVGNHRTTTLITFKDIPGMVKWPCLVCNQRMETNKVRSVKNNDAYIMIYLCFKNGKYSMDDAKQLARMEKFKCCVDHLTVLHDDALHYFGVVDPHIDIHLDNQKIIDAYNQIREIKNSRYVQKLIFEGSRKHAAPFCKSLREYFSTYGRQNYIPVNKNGVPLVPIEQIQYYQEE